MPCENPSTCDCVCTKVIVDPGGADETSVSCDVVGTFEGCRCDLAGAFGDWSVSMWASDAGILFIKAVFDDGVDPPTTYSGYATGVVCDGAAGAEGLFNVGLVTCYSELKGASVQVDVTGEHCVDCNTCDPPLPQTMNIRIEETVAGQFPTVDVGSYTGDFAFKHYEGGEDLNSAGVGCYWLAYIGYNTGGGGNCGLGGFEYEHWWYILDYKTGIIGDWIQCSDSAAEPEIEGTNQVLTGYFYIDYDGTCGVPCAFIAQSDPETWIYARSLDVPLCDHSDNTCNSGVPCEVQDWFIANFSGLTGEWATYNSHVNHISNQFGSDCVWDNDGGSGTWTIQLNWDGTRWVLTLSSFGDFANDCRAIWYGPTDPCNPIGGYIFQSEDTSGCGGDPRSAVGSTAQIQGNY